MRPRSSTGRAENRVRGQMCMLSRPLSTTASLESGRCRQRTELQRTICAALLSPAPNCRPMWNRPSSRAWLSVLRIGTSRSKNFSRRSLQRSLLHLLQLVLLLAKEPPVSRESRVSKYGHLDVRSLRRCRTGFRESHRRHRSPRDTSRPRRRLQNLPAMRRPLLRLILIRLLPLRPCLRPSMRSHRCRPFPPDGSPNPYTPRAPSHWPPGWGVCWAGALLCRSTIAASETKALRGRPSYGESPRQSWR